MIKPEELVPLMILQWVKSDKEGLTEIVKDIDVKGEFTWINFYGGGRINGHVINEMMNLIGVASEEDVEKHLNKKQQEQETLDSNNTNTVIKSPTSKISNQKNTFGFDILDKAQRDSKMKLNILIDFDFISEEKIKMLLELYGDELFESLKDYVRQQLNEDVITSCIEQYLLHKFPKQETNEVLNKEVN